MALSRDLPTIVGPSVELRPFCSDDGSLVQEASLDPHIPLITSVPSTSGAEEAMAFIDRQIERVTSGEGYPFAIVSATTQEAVGAIGLWPRDFRNGRASIGYWIVASQRRQGLASGALRAISSWGLGLDQIHRLELYIEPWNEGSWRAAERAGYQREGVLRDWERIGGQWRDMYMYSFVEADET